MTSKRTVREAHDIYQRNLTFTEEQVDEAIRLLADHGVWSMSNIAAILSLPRHRVGQAMTKTDHTGGRFNPDTLDLLLEEWALKERGETNYLLTAKIAEMGTSAGMIAKLLDQPVSSVKWRIAKGKAVRHGD